MHPFLNIANQASRSAGNLIIRALQRLDTVKVSEKHTNDFVTEIDQQAEKIIIDIIRKNYPNHGILAEESGEQLGDEFTWIIDPLDGTNNFVHGFPHFAISIAIKIKDRIEHALIFDPVRQETFTASRGDGAKLNNYRLRVTNRATLTGSLLGTGFPFRELHTLEPYLNILKTFMPQAGGIRRAGSAALDLAYVAAGRLDGFWEFGLAPWDIAAGALLIKEAGGLISDSQGSEDYLNTGNVVAGNPKVFKLILQTVRANFPATE